jgi:hypothetical protein
VRVPRIGARAHPELFPIYASQGITKDVTALKTPRIGVNPTPESHRNFSGVEWCEKPIMVENESAKIWLESH